MATTGSMYGWIITKDFDPDTSKPEGTYANSKGLWGPLNITAEIRARLEKGEGKEFRMLDDDGEICYEGRIIDDRGDDYKFGPHESPNQGFEPLDDFGILNVGATEIQYKEGTRWVTL